MIGRKVHQRQLFFALFALFVVALLAMTATKLSPVGDIPSTFLIN
jgi:hypothetical protein